MSADNGVYILETGDKFKEISKNHFENLFDKRIIAYRVAHIQAADSFDWYVENELHNLGEWMEKAFGDSIVFYTKEEAFQHAQSLLAAIDYTEYGICTIDAIRYNFPGY